MAERTLPLTGSPLNNSHEVEACHHLIRDLDTEIEALEVVQQRLAGWCSYDQQCADDLTDQQKQFYIAQARRECGIKETEI